MRVLIIGNGFDLDLGLNTRYSDFAKSEEWDNLYANNYYDSGSLAAYLHKMSKSDNWFDIEKCIKDYVQDKELRKDFDINNIYIDKWFLKDLEETFDKYLSGELLFTPLKTNSLASQLILTNSKNSCFNSIYSFNFVEYGLLSYIANGHMENLENVQYVHGIGHDIIFGIDESGSKTTHYSFTKKVMHPKYPSTNIIPDLLEADDIIIFGHSINEIDWNYFKLFFQDSCKVKDNQRREITIITKDDVSMKQIKDNLNSFGISITLLSSICKMEFIATDYYYNGNYEEKEKVNCLLQSLN